MNRDFWSMENSLPASMNLRFLEIIELSNFTRVSPIRSHRTECDPIFLACTWNPYEHSPKPETPP